MEQDTNNQVVYVKDLLFAALYRWRSILASALIFALLFGGAAGVSQWKKTAVPSQGDLDAAMAAYTEQRQLLEEALADAEKQASSQAEYNQESVFMELDPYSIYKATAEVTVRSEDTEDADAEPAPFLHAYAVCLSSDRTVNAIADALGIKGKYVTELIELSDVDQSLGVTVIYPTREGARQILDMLTDALEEAREQLQQTLGPHTVQVMAGGVNECIDLSILERQSAATSRLDTLRTLQSTAKSNLDSLQAPAVAARRSVKKVVLAAVLGAILGAGVAACAAWIGHIAGGKVYSARVLQNRTRLRVLGCVPVGRWKNPVDRWLRRLEGRSSGEDCLPVAAATVRNYCQPQEKLLILGDCSLECQEMVAQALNALGIQATAHGSLLRSAEALRALPECDGVLLVEQCGCSRYTHILQTAQRVSDLNKPLLGCVLLEG